MRVEATGVTKLKVPLLALVAASVLIADLGIVAARAGKDGAAGSAGAPAPSTGPMSPPAPGVYIYNLTLSADIGGQRQEENLSMELDVRPSKRVSGRLRQEVLFSGTGTVPSGRSVYEWRPDALVLISQGVADSTCIRTPPVTVLRLPLRVGDRWSTKADSSCAPSPAPAFSGLTSSRTLRAETVRLDGKPFRAFVIERKTRSASGDPNSASGRELEWFAPQLRLTVRRESTISLKTPGGPGGPILTTRMVEVLKSSRPRPVGD